jgi:hypothetical protein
LLRGTQRLLEIDRAVHEPERPQFGPLMGQLEAVLAGDGRVAGDALLELLRREEVDRYRVVEAQVADLGHLGGDRRDPRVPSRWVPRARRLHRERDGGSHECDGKDHAGDGARTVVPTSRPWPGDDHRSNRFGRVLRRQQRVVGEHILPSDAGPRDCSAA